MRVLGIRLVWVFGPAGVGVDVCPGGENGKRAGFKTQLLQVRFLAGTLWLSGGNGIRAWLRTMYLPGSSPG